MRWYALSLLMLAVDQITKALVSEQGYGFRYEVLPILEFRYACNPGMAFGWLSGLGARWFFVALGVVFSCYFIWEIWRMRKSSEPNYVQLVGFSLILAGALGNVVDRATIGCVTDFIAFHWDYTYFPIFNIADAAISCGAACWIYSLLFLDNPRLRVSQQSSEDIES